MTSGRPWRRSRWPGSTGRAAGGASPSRPTGPAGSRLDRRLADGRALDAWVASELRATAGGHRDLAGALIVYRLAGHLAELVVGCLLDQRRALPLGPATVALRFGDAARLDEMAVTSDSVSVLADDPDAGAPGTDVVPTADALRAVAADGLVATFGPVADAVRARAPFGLRGMWGTLADHVAEVAVRRARDQRGDVDAAMAAGDHLLDALATRVSTLVDPTPSAGRGHGSGPASGRDQGHVLPDLQGGRAAGRPWRGGPADRPRRLHVVPVAERGGPCPPVRRLPRLEPLRRAGEWS